MTNREASRALSLQKKGYLPKTIAEELGLSIVDVRSVLASQFRSQPEPKSKPKPKRKRPSHENWLQVVKQELKRGADPEVLRMNFPEEMKQLEEKKK